MTAGLMCAAVMVTVGLIAASVGAARGVGKPLAVGLVLLFAGAALGSALIAAGGLS